MQEEIKKQIKELVKKYESAKNTTGIRHYSEEDTVRDFILPLFNILGWDTFDKKEVSAQEHIKGSDIEIEIKPPTQEKSLQVVDMLSWAIFRKYEYGDESYYNLIKTDIIEENPLFG